MPRPVRSRAPSLKFIESVQSTRTPAKKASKEEAAKVTSLEENATTPQKRHLGKRSHCTATATGKESQKLRSSKRERSTSSSMPSRELEAKKGVAKKFATKKERLNAPSEVSKAPKSKGASRCTRVPCKMPPPSGRSPGAKKRGGENLTKTESTGASSSKGKKSTPKPVEKSEDESSVEMYSSDGSEDSEDDSGDGGESSEEPPPPPPSKKKNKGKGAYQHISNELLYYNIVTTPRAPGKRQVKPVDFVFDAAGGSSMDDATDYQDDESSESYSGESSSGEVEQDGD